MSEIMRNTRSGIRTKGAIEREEQRKKARLEKHQKVPDAEKASAKPTASTAPHHFDDDFQEPSPPPKVDGPKAPETRLPFAPQVKVVDGQLVIDASSLIVTTEAPTVSHDDFEMVHESATTHRVTAASFSKRPKSKRWTAEETEKFYDCLRQYGTDFTLLARLFPGRDRRDMKTKYKREELNHPQRLDQTLRRQLKHTSEETACALYKRMLDDVNVEKERLKVQKEKEDAEVAKLPVGSPPPAPSPTPSPAPSASPAPAPSASPAPPPQRSPVPGADEEDIYQLPAEQAQYGTNVGDPPAGDEEDLLADYDQERPTGGEEDGVLAINRGARGDAAGYGDEGAADYDGDDF
ncbi:putative transcription factor TFIIIB component b'' [Paratrimastix pyriformis]|uniref:Transcription factor TFIIIB component b n=1 Tax=Paratrimastix pyriformis TaxID=342808 RepID=A0ABQ8UQW2_9EUKA|nr:putative transcription factor TFIIIB component b'' [Paratrimastix pyriformis]